MGDCRMPGAFGSGGLFSGKDAAEKFSDDVFGKSVAVAKRSCSEPFSERGAKSVAKRISKSITVTISFAVTITITVGHADRWLH